jgi:hypothetical protein
VTLNFSSKNADFGASRATLCTHKRARIDFFNRLSGSRKVVRPSYPKGTISLPYFRAAILPASDGPREEAGRLDAAHETISAEVPPLGRRRRKREGPTTTSGEDKCTAWWTARRRARQGVGNFLLSGVYMARRRTPKGRADTLGERSTRTGG